MQYPPPYPSYPPKPNAWQRFRAQNCGVQFVLGCAGLIVLFVFVVLCSIATPAFIHGWNTADVTPTPSPTASAVSQRVVSITTSTPTPTRPKPTPTPASHYPPKTKADLQSLAAQGTASAVSEFHSESVGLTGVCPQPKREVTVPTSLTGQKLAEDLLAYYYANQIENPCGAVVFAYHNQSEAGDFYSAGRILLNVTDASGQVNTDPNASGLKYTLTLDLGGADSSQEYVVAWTQ